MRIIILAVTKSDDTYFLCFYTEKYHLFGLDKLVF